jgi:hypothetical protein
MQQHQHDEACPSINDEDGLRTDDDFDSTSGSDLDSTFDSSDDELDTASDTDSESHSKEISDTTNDDDDDDLFDGELNPHHKGSSNMLNSYSRFICLTPYAFKSSLGLFSHQNTTDSVS